MNNKYSFKINRKGFLARDWIMALMIFGVIIALGGVIFSDLATTYDNPNIIDSNFNNSYNTFAETSRTTETMYQTLTTGGGLSVFGTASLVFNSVFTVFNLVLSSLLLPANVLKNFMIDYGIPTVVGNIFMALYVLIPTVVIIFVILSSQTRRDI